MRNKNQLKQMKTTASIFTKITLGVLLAGSITACNQNKTADKTAASQTTTSDKPEIVYINQDTLSLKYDYAKDMRKRLEDKGKSAQSDVGGRKQAFQREVAEYQKDASTLSADQRATKEQRLQREGQELQTYKEYAKDNSYKMVFTFTNGNTNLLFADKSLDVTADFLKKLNDAYAKEKK
jgi:outer membrane protein